jgi:hypothetical protein
MKMLACAFCVLVVVLASSASAAEGTKLPFDKLPFDT